MVAFRSQAVDTAQYLGVLLKIIVNAVSAKIGGAATYIAQFLQNVSAAAPNSQFLVFLPPETIQKNSALPDNVRQIPTRVDLTKPWRRLWWDQVTLRRFVKKQKPDILFSTANFGMLHCPVRQILLVRNALYFSKTFEEMFLRKYLLRWKIAFKLRRWLVCESVRHADLVMTPTATMLEELRQFVKIPLDKALVNPYGQSIFETRCQLGDGRAADRQLGKGAPIRLLFVSHYREHKNLTTLLKAIPLLNREVSGKFHLTTTVNPRGEDARWTLTVATDLALASQSDIRDSLRAIGPLNPAETRSLYEDADIFVFPSLTESFGFPLVEAMAHGLPVVAADTPVNREVCQEAALYFPPLDFEALAVQVERVATDDSLRGKLGAAGRERVASCFSWRTHVERVLKAAHALVVASPRKASTPSILSRPDQT